MLGVVVLAALLGVTNVLDCSETESSVGVLTNFLTKTCQCFKDLPGKIESWFCPMNGCKPQTNDVPAKAADSAKAREILNSIGNAAEIFSIRAGGGGDNLFPTNAVQMKDDMPPVVAESIEGCFNANVAPLGGYVCQYEVDPARTNFLCKAIPANGYTGGVFVVRKDKTIRQVDDKMPKKDRRPLSVSEVKVASKVKATDPEKASEILNSIGNAAEIFSIRAGGGGDNLFPTNAVQMRDNMPPVVARSIEGCFNAPVAPLGGYVCQYEVDPARTNFLCKATPANGYTGAVFVVQKDKKIVHVDDVTCISTNSMSRKSK